MTGRYELSNQQWALIEDIVSPPRRMGRPRHDDRQMLNGLFWILCSGAKWCDLPERYGPWKTVYQRFRHWRDDGTFERILARLHLKLLQDGYLDLDTWMIDSPRSARHEPPREVEKRGPGRTARSCVGP
ncbi:transposase [Pseudomonas sp. EpS/L25]|nr:transposase [Pseudomonas sp. EpS/L25]